MSESMKGLMTAAVVISILVLVVVSCVSNIIKGLVAFFAIYGVIFVIGCLVAWLKAGTSYAGEKLWTAITNVFKVIDENV